MSEPKDRRPEQTGQADPSRGLTIEDLGLTTASLTAQGRRPRDLFQAWFHLFKTAQIHAIDNRALRRPVEEFLEVTRRIVNREGYASFQAKDRALFVNSVKLRLSTEDYELASDVFEFFDQRGMGGFLVEGPLTREEIRELLQILVYAPPSQRTFDRLEAKVRGSGLPFRINRPLGTAARSDAQLALERRAYTFFTYSKLVVLYRSLIAEERVQPIKRRFLVRKIVRTVQALVDICLEDDHTFLGVSAVKAAAAYDPHHAANVAVLSIVVGEKLGLGKVDLRDLGLAGLFHDVGMRWTSRSLLEKPGPLAAQERSMVRRHPFRGVEFLLGEPNFTRSVLRRIIVACEHHRGSQGGGYPELPLRPHLFSRIVAIADAYDALTTHRPWRKAYLPDEALGLMMSKAGEQFDPLLLKIFVNSLGLYPAGTLVRLSTGELAIVLYSGSEGGRTTRPIVALLDPGGRPARAVDLTDRAKDGGYRRSIVSSEDPTRYGLQLSGLLASSPAV